MKYQWGLTILIFSNCCFAANLSTDYDDVIGCTVCHGINFQGNQPTGAPAIAGMDFWYLIAQLNAFRSGSRGTHDQDFSGMEMQPQAAVLDEKKIEPISQFISELATAIPPTTVVGDSVRGEDLYQSCSTCHGLDGKGNEALGAPRLNRQNDWYLESQLNKYRSGIRGGSAQGKQMQAAVGLLETAQDVRDIVKYINTLENQSP